MIYKNKQKNRNSEVGSSDNPEKLTEAHSNGKRFYMNLLLVLSCLVTLISTIGKITVVQYWYNHTGSLRFVLPDFGLAVTSAFFLYIYIFKLLGEYKTELTKLKKRLDELTGFIDPIRRGLTITEVKLLETLCTYRESNAMLSKRLGKSKSTIKVQLLSIFNKIGVDNRHDLIDSCRHYFNQDNK